MRAPPKMMKGREVKIPGANFTIASRSAPEISRTSSRYSAPKPSAASPARPSKANRPPNPDLVRARTACDGPSSSGFEPAAPAIETPSAPHLRSRGGSHPCPFAGVLHRRSDKAPDVDAARVRFWPSAELELMQACQRSHRLRVRAADSTRRAREMERAGQARALVWQLLDAESSRRVPQGAARLPASRGRSGSQAHATGPFPAPLGSAHQARDHSLACVMVSEKRGDVPWAFAKLPRA